MEKDIAIVDATIKDIKDILEIEDLCFGAEKFSRRQFAYLITKAKGKFLVAKSSNKVLAYISLIINSQYKRGRIYSIAVRPDARGNKLGKMLLEKAIEYACQQKINIISLEVKITNTPAIALYQNYGFKITGVIPCYYEDGSDAFRMESDISVKNINSIID